MERRARLFIFVGLSPVYLKFTIACQKIFWGMSKVTNVSKSRRTRLSVDLDAYPDVKEILDHVEQKVHGVSRSRILMSFLRNDFSRRGWYHPDGRINAKSIQTKVLLEWHELNRPRPQ